MAFYILEMSALWIDLISWVSKYSFCIRASFCWATKSDHARMYLKRSLNFSSDMGETMSDLGCCLFLAASLSDLLRREGM